MTTDNNGVYCDLYEKYVYKPFRSLRKLSWLYIAFLMGIVLMLILSFRYGPIDLITNYVLLGLGILFLLLWPYSLMVSEFTVILTENAIYTRNKCIRRGSRMMIHDACYFYTCHNLRQFEYSILSREKLSKWRRHWFVFLLDSTGYWENDESVCIPRLPEAYKKAIRAKLKDSRSDLCQRS